jgi:two-component system sensor histidine kinase and response regulator WspE
MLVVQPLDPRLGKVSDIAAASLMEDGAPVLIVDYEDLMRSMARLSSSARVEVVARPSQDAARIRRKRILVVDDSLTVRELQRKLLTNGGYDVSVAVDGSEGWNALMSERFDLVVTDVDMPRIDGIELVMMIRRDPEFRTLPVMIVSYKDRPTDRQRGLDAGADYYLAKSSFHDAALLDAVRDLIGETPG